jgi:hypothetical protein
VTEIVKVQRPLIGSPPPDGRNDGPILVFDETRTHEQFRAPDDLPAWLARKLETNPKVFALAHWTKRRGWKFDGPAPWADW